MVAPVASNMLPEKENCTQDFLNAGQYKRNGILRYEKVFGHTFVSTGGLTTTKQIVDPIGLKPGMKVLDIGCGTGGSAFYMAMCLKRLALRMFKLLTKRQNLSAF